MQRLARPAFVYALRISPTRSPPAPLKPHLICHSMSTNTTSSSTPSPATTQPSTAYSTARTTALCQLLGVQFSHVSAQRVEARYTVTSTHLQPAKLLHGGVNALVGEEVASTAAAINAPPGHTIVGTRITLNHVGSAAEGDVVTVAATPLHLGKQLQLWEIKAEKEGKDGGEKKVLSMGEMQAFVKAPRTRSKL